MNKPFVDLTTEASPFAAEIEQILIDFGCRLNDRGIRARAGEMLSYRQGRIASMARARRAKKRGDTEEMMRLVRAARSQQRVVMRRLRRFRADTKVTGLPPGDFWWR